MDFGQLLDHAIEMLQHHGRVTYRTLKRQFHLDDDVFEDLKDALVYSQPQVSDDTGRGLIWTDAPATPEVEARRGADAERQLYTLLPAVMWLLQHDKRVTYRTLKYVLGVDDALLSEIREELLLRQVAVDEGGQVLVWTSEAPGAAAPTAAVAPSQPAITEATAVPAHPQPRPAPPSRVPPIATAINGPTVSPVDAPTDIPPDAPVVASEPSRPTPEAERRHLTVMFCDLADSTQLSQQLDPEDLRDVVRAYQATAAEVIAQYDGHMAQYLGDGLLIYFGWPVAHEDDAQRALHAGLGLVEAITTSLNPRLEHEKGVRLTVRLGIHTGPVVVGEMGGGGRHENLATGETVNIASRLEGLARPDTVVISAMTERLVRHSFALEDLGAHDLKGVAQPMAVFRVLGLLDTSEDETSAAGVSFLVGRDEELGLLLRRWEQSKERLGQVVLVSGTAGIGKSSLVEVLRAHVRREGLPRITLRCSSYHHQSALYPVITHVERLLDVQREDAPATKLDKLEQGLRPYSQPLDEVVPLFASLLSVPLDGRYPMPTLTPPQQKQQTLDALVAWMLEEAEKQPVLVVWEDLQWGDPSTLEMLGLVLEQTPTVPMLHVLTYRPDFAPPWPSRSHMTPITLNRLERPQVEALISHLAGSKRLPPEVVAHITGKTDGVPLYVEELTKMLLASELLREAGDHYELTGPLLSVAIPDTLQDALMARLDQLNTAKEVAQLGAVLGREFPYELIQAISSQDAETVQCGLRQLVQAELLYQRGRPPRARYLFKHALIQDTAYASLLRSRRQQVHQQVAQLLEARFPETVETQPELVAQHYTEAGCVEPAIGYWYRAGHLALQRSANPEAIAHLRQGVALVTTLPETPERLQQALDLQVALGPALMATQGYGDPDVEHAYAQARRLCEQVGESAQFFHVLRGQWRVYLAQGAVPMARELAEQLLALAQRQDEADLLLAAYPAIGQILYQSGEFASARVHLEQGIQLGNLEQQRAQAVRYGQAPSVQCCVYLSQVLWYLGHLDQALQRRHDAHALARELAHPLSCVVAQYHVAAHHQRRGEALATYEHADALITLATEHGFTQYVAMGMVFRGWALTLQGEGETGIPQIEQGLATYQATGSVLARPLYLSILIDAYRQADRVDDGFAVVTEGFALTERTGLHYTEAEFSRCKGELLLQKPVPDAAEAETCFHQALDVARSQQAKSLELRAATSLARLWQSQGKRQEAYDLLAPVYGWFTEGFDTADVLEAKTLLQELA